MLLLGLLSVASVGLGFRWTFRGVACRARWSCCPLGVPWGLLLFCPLGFVSELSAGSCSAFRLGGFAGGVVGVGCDMESVVALLLGFLLRLVSRPLLLSLLSSSLLPPCCTVVVRGDVCGNSSNNNGRKVSDAAETATCLPAFWATDLFLRQLLSKLPNELETTTKTRKKSEKGQKNQTSV